MKTYAEKLKDPRWQRKRLEIMERDGFTCRDCGTTKNTLAVHHAYYVTGRLPWMYPSWSLTTLCSDCHSERHDQVKNCEEDHVEGYQWRGTDWESSIGLLGIEKMTDFEESLFDIGAEINQHKVNTGVSKLDWLMQAVLNQKISDNSTKS